MRKLLTVLLLTCGNLSLASELSISFGSCYKQKDESTVFENIKDTNSDAFFGWGILFMLTTIHPNEDTEPTKQ